ncbi:putative ribosomal RNA small subunit methyltransferase B [Bienertia sinuspersici]
MMETTANLPLPDAFIDFLKQNGLDPSIYTSSDTLPRYIRLKPGCEAEIEEIEAEFKCKLNEVVWLPSFYSLPPHVQIANSKAYQDGKVYGIDAASGAAVHALNIVPGDHVLDLCAAPGAKLCMILDLLGNSGSVTGVDVARHRLAACRTMVRKYVMGDHCRLFVADGTSFSLIPIRVSAASKLSSEFTSEEEVDVFKEWTSKRPWKERKRAAKAREATFRSSWLQRDELYRSVHGDELSTCGYDKVLVDAECTHDGSIRHVQKFENWGWQTLQRRVLDAERTDDLTNLQFRLLSNGFQLLKTGGSLVYSTCSLTVAQNEEVIERFLLENSSAELHEIDNSGTWPCKSGRVSKTLRFDPVTSQTSGLFVAKFTKLPT